MDSNLKPEKKSFLNIFSFDYIPYNFVGGLFYVLECDYCYNNNDK